MSPKENQTHVLSVIFIFLEKCSCTVDIFPKGEDKRDLFFAGCNIRSQVSSTQKTKGEVFVCLVAWFGEGRWCGAYCCDMLPQNINHTTGTAAFPVFQDTETVLQENNLTQSCLRDGANVSSRLFYE